MMMRISVMRYRDLGFGKLHPDKRESFVFNLNQIAICVNLPSSPGNQPLQYVGGMSRNSLEFRSPSDVLTLEFPFFVSLELLFFPSRHWTA
jgi:hypothetical protein